MFATVSYNMVEGSFTLFTRQSNISWGYRWRGSATNNCHTFDFLVTGIVHFPDLFLLYFDWLYLGCKLKRVFVLRNFFCASRGTISISQWLNNCFIYKCFISVALEGLWFIDDTDLCMIWFWLLDKSDNAGELLLLFYQSTQKRPK